MSIKNNNQEQDFDNDFLHYYQKNIAPLVKKFEQNRVESLRLTIITSLLVIPITIGMILFELFLFIKLQDTHPDISTWMLVFMIGTVWACVFIIRAPIKNYKRSVKSIIFPIIFKYFGPNFLYQNDKPDLLLELEQSAILPNYTEVFTESYIKSSHKNVAIELLETKFISGSTKSKITAFKGLLILLSSNKKFNANTFIINIKTSNWFTNKWNQKANKDWLANQLRARNKLANISLETVHLEDPIFNKKFAVFSSDQIEARYLLTTSFMERLLKLNQLFGKNSMQCSFYNNHLLIMIPTNQPRFEISSIFKRVNFLTDCRIIMAQMKEIYQIIDILKLDQKIGL